MRLRDGRFCKKDQLQHVTVYTGRCQHSTIARWNANENRFYLWREKSHKIYIETAMYPTDETKSSWNVFNVLEELPNAKFEIPFDRHATFTGNPVDLTEYDEEMR